MNRNLRLKIEESIDTEQLSENLCFLCLACLHEKITFSKQSLRYLENQRNIIASTAIKNGVDKTILQDKILKISKNDYPTFKTISTIAEMIQNNNYLFVSGFIPDKMIHYKNVDELQADLARKPVKKKVDIDAEDFTELCRYVAKEVLYYPDNVPLANNQKDILKKMKTSQYTYDIILRCFKQYRGEIERALFGKAFKTEFNKLQYIIGIVKNYLPDVLKWIENQKKSEEIIENLDLSHLFHPCVEYQSEPKEEISDRLKDIFKDLW